MIQSDLLSAEKTFFFLLALNTILHHNLTCWVHCNACRCLPMWATLSWRAPSRAQTWWLFPQVSSSSSSQATLVDRPTAHTSGQQGGTTPTV